MNSEFEISEELLANWISQAKADYNIDLTEDQAIDEIYDMHNKGCLVENSGNCKSCPKFEKDCPL